MKKWDILENIKVEKLVFWAKWFARLKSDNKDLDNRVIFIKGWAVPSSIVDLRVIKKRKDYIETQIVNVRKKADFELNPKCSIFWKCGGCKWQTIPYKMQLEIKSKQIEESLFHLKKYQEDIDFLWVRPSPLEYNYRNKIEFSFGKFLSKKYDIEEHFNLWFHKQWEFSKIVDCSNCDLVSKKLNKIFLKIKDFALSSGLPVYDQMRHEGFFRHLLMRETYFQNEIMIVLSYNPKFEFDNLDSKISEIKDFLISLSSDFPEIKSIYLSANTSLADVALGDLELIYGSKTITEKLEFDYLEEKKSLSFDISPRSFFQTNSPWARELYQIVLDFADKSKLKNTLCYDLYAGTWTIGLLFTPLAKKVYSVELVTDASKDWEKNAIKNQAENIDFINKKVEDFLSDIELSDDKSLVIIDPPRSGMHPKALENIFKFKSDEMIYVSCNPATLARDLEYIIKNSSYKIEKVIWMDMFPHTHHIETVVLLKRKDEDMF